MHGDALLGEGQRVTAGPAPDIEHPHARCERELTDEELDLLLGALGERVPQVRGAKVIGQRFKPVRHQPLAAAQVSPQLTLTSRGTSSLAAFCMMSMISGPTTSRSSRGTSTSTSSWTCNTTRLRWSPAVSAASMRTRATLKMSAASPWIPAFIA